MDANTKSFSVQCSDEDAAIETISDIVSITINSGTVQEATRIASINKIVCQAQDSSLTTTSIDQQGFGNGMTVPSTSNQVAACPGGYVGFDYWYTEDDQMNETGIAAIRFYCENDGIVVPEETVGSTEPPGGVVYGMSSFRCSPGQSLHSLGGFWRKTDGMNPPNTAYGNWISLRSDGTVNSNIMATCVNSPPTDGDGDGGDGNGSSTSSTSKSSSAVVAIFVGIGVVILIIIILAVILFFFNRSSC